MLTPRFLAGFTGHRTGYDEASVRGALSTVLTRLQGHAAQAAGHLELYTSLAEGTDLLCVSAARQLGLPVHLLLPLAEPEFAKDFSSPAAWEQARAELTTARQRPGRDSIHLVSGAAPRPDCYFDQGIQMLDAIDVLIAVWDGQSASGLGGTGQITAQAQATGIPVILIHPVTGAITLPENLAARFQPDPIITELNALATRHQVPCAIGAADPEQLQACLDQIAITEAARFRPSRVRVILLHGLAALLAAAVSYQVTGTPPWFSQNRWILTAIELVLVLAALGMSIRLRQRHTQETWIRCRFACELVRGLRASLPLLDPLHPPISRHDPAWKRFALSAGLLVQAHQPSHDPIALRDHYLNTRLSLTHPESQILHYQTKRPTALRWWKFTGFLGTWSARLAPAFVLLSLLNKFNGRWHPDHAWNLQDKPIGWIAVALLPIVLPLIAGTASGLRHALDAGRRQDRYPQMAARLTEIRAALPGLQTPTTLRTALTHSEEILLDELLEWKLALKNSNH